MPRNHPAVMLKHPFEQNYEAPIDVEIVDLIMACWLLRIGTAQSCQDYTERQEAWIRFASAEDALRFFRVTLPVAKDMKWFSHTNPVTTPEVYFPHSEIGVIAQQLKRARCPRVL